MFKLLLYNSFCLNLVICDFPLFKVSTHISKNYYNTQRQETCRLFRRSGSSNCSNYEDQNNPEVTLFIDDYYEKWRISDNFGAIYNENDPSCQKRIAIHYYENDYLDSLELCNTISGYELDGATQMTVAGDNCQERVEKLVENSTEHKYVFYSTTGWLPNKCQFANFGDVKLMKSNSGNLSVYHKKYTEEEILNTSEEKNNTAAAIESQTLIFGLIGLSTFVLVGLTIFITVFCIKRRGMICNNKRQKDEVIVHQNELYGNLSNQDYFEERYDTNILDRNQYYEEEYEA